jgi:putative hemolysin
MAAEILVIVALILLNGVFAGGEIAVLSVRKTRLGELVEGKVPGARAVQWLRAEPERFLATVQVAITLITTTAAAFGGETLAVRLGDVLASVPRLAPYAKTLALGIVVVTITFLGIVIGELVPKSLALRWAERYALVIGPVLRALATAAKPAVWVLTKASNLVLKVFGDQTSFTEARLSPEEIQELVEEAARVGSLDAKTGEIASRALDFRELTAADVMVPRLSMVSLPKDASAVFIREIYEKHRYARMPVFEGSPENLVGYVAIRDLVGQALSGPPVSIGAIMRPAQFVPHSLMAAKLLKQMQTERIPMAIVVDENGAVMGLVTIEDLVEELVGDILSEHDPGPPVLPRAADGSVVLPGTMPIREANRTLGLDLPEPPDQTTVAGLCIHLAGRIPAKGAVLTTEDGTVIEVLDASPRRVRTVRILPAKKEGEEAPEAAV